MRDDGEEDQGGGGSAEWLTCLAGAVDFAASRADKDGMTAAAVKIQASFRGNKARGGD